MQQQQNKLHQQQNNKNKKQSSKQLNYDIPSSSAFSDQSGNHNISLKYDSQHGQSQQNRSNQNQKNANDSQKKIEDNQGNNIKAAFHNESYQDFIQNSDIEMDDEQSLQNQQITQNRKQPNMPNGNYNSLWQAQYNNQDQNQTYENIHYGNNSHSCLIRNTDGRNITERGKRNFIKMLMDKIRGLEKPVAHKIISQQSDKIKVYSNQVAIWLSIYRIVFAVQFQRLKRRLSQQQQIYQVQHRLIDYLNHNPYQKKYKFIKISNRAFRSLKIKKCTGDYWLASLFKKFNHAINPVINLNLLLRKSNQKNCNLPLYNQPFQSLIHDKINSNLDINGQNAEGQRYNIDLQQHPDKCSTQFKANIVQAIDNEIQRAVSDIFYHKQHEYHINISSLKTWYINYGKIDLFGEATQQQPQKQQPKQHNNKNENANMDINEDGIQKIQKQILNSIKINQINTRQKIYHFAIILINRFNVKQLAYQSVFLHWINLLIFNHCAQSNGVIRLKDNSTLKMQIPNLHIPLTNFHIKYAKQQVKHCAVRNIMD